MISRACSRSAVMICMTVEKISARSCCTLSLIRSGGNQPAQKYASYSHFTDHDCAAWITAGARRRPGTGPQKGGSLGHGGIFWHRLVPSGPEPLGIRVSHSTATDGHPGGSRRGGQSPTGLGNTVPTVIRPASLRRHSGFHRLREL